MLTTRLPATIVAILYNRHLSQKPEKLTVVVSNSLPGTSCHSGVVLGQSDISASPLCWGPSHASLLFAPFYTSSPYFHCACAGTAIYELKVLTSSFDSLIPISLIPSTRHFFITTFGPSLATSLSFRLLSPSSSFPSHLLMILENMSGSMQ